MVGQFGWFPTSRRTTPALDKVNAAPHRYIYYVAYGNGGGLVIRGKIGERVYFDYSLRAAMTKYNAEAKAA